MSLSDELSEHVARPLAGEADRGKDRRLMHSDDAAAPGAESFSGEEPAHLADFRDFARQVFQARPSGDQLNAALRDYLADAAGDDAPLTPAADLTDGILADLDQRRAAHLAGRKVLGHATGFATLDNILGGLEAQRLTVLMAEPGAGKTTFSNQLAYTVAASGAPVLYVSFENTPAALTLRHLARLAGKSVTDVERGRIDPSALAPARRRFDDAAASLYYVAGTKSTTVAAIRGHVERLRARHPDAGHPLVVIDYLQRLARAGSIGRADDARLRVGSISQELTDLARDTGAHVWAISSVNRGAYGKEKAKPTLASAKESGDIEFDADAALTLNKPENPALPPINKHEFALSVVKHRHGESGGAVSVLRDRDTLEFAEWETKAPGGALVNRVRGGA
jgi:replicative DNA helicase